MTTSPPINPEGDDPRRWRRIYLAVVGIFAAYVGLLFWLSRAFV